MIARDFPQRIVIVIDGVSHATTLNAGQIPSVPDLGADATRPAQGLGSIDRRMILLAYIVHPVGRNAVRLFEAIVRAA